MEHLLFLRREGVEDSIHEDGTAGVDIFTGCLQVLESVAKLTLRH